MKSPPAGVKLVMHAICIMLGHVPEVLLGGRVKDMDTVIRVCVCGWVCKCSCVRESACADVGTNKLVMTYMQN